MKRLIALLMAFIVIFTLAACQKDTPTETPSKEDRPGETTPPASSTGDTPRIKRVTVEHDWVEEYIFEYDANRLVAITEYNDGEYLDSKRTFNGSIHMPTSSVIYNNFVEQREYKKTYDENGNLLEEIRYNVDGNEHLKNQYQYDANGNEIEQIYYYEGELSYQHTQTYDSNGLLTSSDHYYFGNYPSSNLITMEYNSQGDVTKQVTIRTSINSLGEEDSSESILTFENTYDQSGNLLSAIGYTEDGDEEYRTTYQYNEQGSVTEEVVAHYGDVEFSKTYQYDENGSVTYYAYLSCFTDTDGEVEYVESYYYENGKEIRYVENRNGKDVEIINYIYDNNGNLVKKEWELGDVRTIEYSYDQHNCLVKRVITTSSRTETYTYEYDYVSATTAEAESLTDLMQSFIN